MAVATGDYLGIGGQFLMWLAVAKAFNRKAARDWQQLYLLSFLMLVAGSVLNADLTYGACFLGFVISSTWALTLFHLRREMEDNLLVKHAADRASERVEVRRILDSKRIVGTKFFVGTGALSFGVFLGSAIVFLSLPRVGAGFFLKTRGGTSFAGFSDAGVKLGGHGVIKNDDTVVMRVEIDPKFGGLDAPEIHWRGVAFEKYEAGQWSHFPITPDTREARVDAPSGHERRHRVPRSATTRRTRKARAGRGQPRSSKTCGSSRSTPTCCSAAAGRACSTTRPRSCRAASARSRTTSTTSITTARSTTRCGRRCGRRAATCCAPRPDRRRRRSRAMRSRRPGPRRARSSSRTRSPPA